MLAVFYSNKNLLEIRELRPALANRSNKHPVTAAAMASGRSAGLNRSNAAHIRDSRFAPAADAAAVGRGSGGGFGFGGTASESPRTSARRGDGGGRLGHSVG